MRFIDNGISTKIRTDQLSLYIIDRQNLNYREGQTENTPVYKYYFITKAFKCTLNFNYRGPLLMTIEAQSALKGEYYKRTLVAPLCHLHSLGVQSKM